tara:strand:+ start:552 stop:971 length:420 start_codon:yes stop_codon:yes gene_type:complete
MPKKSRNKNTQSRGKKPQKNTAQRIIAENNKRMEKEKIEAEQKKHLEEIIETENNIARIKKQWNDPGYLRDEQDKLYMLIHAYNIKYGESTSGRSTKNKRKGKKGKKRKKGGTGTRTRTATKTKTRKKYNIKHHDMVYA